MRKFIRLLAFLFFTAAIVLDHAVQAQECSGRFSSSDDAFTSIFGDPVEIIEPFKVVREQERVAKTALSAAFSSMNPQQIQQAQVEYQKFEGYPEQTKRFRFRPISTVLMGADGTITAIAFVSVQLDRDGRSEAVDVTVIFNEVEMFQSQDFLSTPMGELATRLQSAIVKVRKERSLENIPMMFNIEGSKIEGSFGIFGETPEVARNLGEQLLLETLSPILHVTPAQ